MKSALLLSGGMDSLALAWWKRPDIAVTIDYGQRAAQAELQASETICSRLKIKHLPITVDCSPLGSGDMVGETVSALAAKSDWWPFRNQLLITLASMKLIDLGVSDLAIASVATDANHTDGTPTFLGLIDELTACQEGNIRITAPAISMTTLELIRRSGIPMTMLAWSHSCHKANVACGQCRGCWKHMSVYESLNVDDSSEKSPS